MAIATFEEIRQKKREPEFVRRMNDPNAPFIRNPDGSISTHLMRHDELDDGSWIAYPSIVNRDGKLEELSGREAMAYALENEEYKKFDTEAEAETYAKGSWKKKVPSFEELRGKPTQVPSFEEVRQPSPDFEEIQEQTSVDLERAKIGPWEPSLWERVKTRFTTSPPPGGWDRTDRPFRTLGQAALYGLGKYGTGRALYAPKLVDKDIAKKISGFDPTVKEESIGDFLEFIGGLRSAGRILGPVIGMLPTVSGQAIIGGAGTFGLRNISEQLVDWAATGKTPSLEAFEKDTALGALFGTAEVGLIKFVGFVRGLKGLSKAKLRPARAEVDKAIKHFKKTGDRSLWDEVRIKYAGIEPEAAARIRARAKPTPPVKEFGKYPLARAGEAVRPPTELAAAPKLGVRPEKGIKLPPKPTQAEIVAERAKKAAVPSPITFGPGHSLYKKHPARYEPAFEHLETGKIYKTGAVHDWNKLPKSIQEEIKNRPDVLVVDEGGFVDLETGEYLNRQQVASRIKEAEAPPAPKVAPGIEVEEHIVSAAMKVGKKVFTGNSHVEIIREIVESGELPERFFTEGLLKRKDVDLFLTNKGRLVNLEEAKGLKYKGKVVAPKVAPVAEGKPEEIAKRLGVPIKIIPKGLRAKAQYRKRTDDIAVRSHLPKGFDRDAAIAHELGHRAHTKISNKDMDAFNKLVEEFRQDINKNVGRNITYFEEKGDYHGYFEAFAELYGRYIRGQELPNNQFKSYFDKVTPSALERKPAKEAWEMTFEEYSKKMDLEWPGKTMQRRFRDYNEAVEEATKQGLPVPREVLLEYKSEKWAQEALKEKPETKDEYRARIKEVKAKVPEGEISRQPVTVEGKKYYPVSLPVEKISVDAERFQFKLGAKLVGGVTEALKDVERFDPVKGGQIFVWQDKAGKYWVVDGHHRVALAKKTGAEFLETWVVSEKDGVTEQDARAIGALRNLADGKGTAVDAAKLFRDSNISLEELRKNAVPTNSTVVQQGLDMADLSDEVFRLVVDERLPANMAAAIGKQVKSPAQQKQVADLILEGEVETLRQAELLAATIDSAPVLTKTEQTLFGLETTEKSLYAERAKVLANVEKKLKTNKKVFGVLATQTGIIEAKGNILAKVENLATKEKAEEVLFMLEKLANSKGPVAEALNDATKQYAENPTKENLSKVTTTLLEKWTEGPGRLRIPERKGVPELPLERVEPKVAVPTFEEIRKPPTKAPEVAPGMEIYADKVPPTDVPSKVALHNAVTRALNADYKKVRATKKKYKGLKNEKQLYDKQFSDKPELFIHPEDPLPEMRAAWTIAVKGKGLFGGTMKGGFIDVRPLEKVHKSVVNIIESAKPVEIKYGKEVSAEVIKGIHNVDVARIEFNEAEIEGIDRSLDEFGKLLSRYSNKVLTNLMIARGKPKAPEAIALQKKALEELAKEAPELIGLRKMITRIGDFTHKYLQRVAGDEVKYVEDYYYGIYKDAKKIRRWLDHWTTTKRFLKEKKWFTVAEAMAVGQLELRDPNPVHNIRSEYMAIAHLDGMISMRDELMKLGKDKFISDNPGLLAEPEKIPDPIFKGLYVDEPLAQMIKSLISTSKVHKIPALNTLRQVNNVMRAVKFAGSMFHHLSVLKQSIVDSGYLGFLLPNRWAGIHRRPGKAIPYGLHKETAARGFTFGFRTNDPIFKTKFYKRYIKSGGGHRYSIESQAQRMITNSVDKFNSMIGKPLKAALFVPQIPVKYVKWMFQSYIPKVKYMKTIDEYNKRTKKLGRDLTDAELQEIIKEGQNFYGMMNERLFGRSATTTQLLRFRFMSPGYWFGNMRSILKGAIQWGFGKQFRASRSRANIINSFLFTGMAATIGTLIMTRKWPKKPESKEDIRDLFKIDTGWLDAQGNRIMIDLMTYDRDYWNIYGKLLVGQAGEIPGEVWRRMGGMSALSFDILSDLNRMSEGKAIYDYTGKRVVEITDPFTQRVMSLVWHEFQKAEPISVSVFSQARKKDLNNLQAGMLMLLGLRLTKTEKAKREQQILKRIWSLFDRQESLYYYLGTIKEPREHIEHYNSIVNSIFDNPITTDEMRKKYYKGRIIDVDRLLENKAHYLAMQNRTPEEIEKTKKYLENFGVTPTQAQEYLRGYWQRERRKVPVSPLERDRVIGRTRKRKRLAERMAEQ